MSNNSQALLLAMDNNNQEYNSDDDENTAFHGIAKNLLDIRNSSKWEGEMKENISVVKSFEPKFFQVFVKYCESIKQTLQTSNHLMSICLENLISFCSWARESNNRVAWLKEVLDDNLDLRPEVRNGLSMILIYTFATAKAQDKANEDMFSILQDTDAGLGIVNKTSLKIYNDPYFYFVFLKSCISGLIDAGKVPENERQNQVSTFYFVLLTYCFQLCSIILVFRVLQPKKPKRVSDNKGKQYWDKYIRFVCF